MHDPAQTAIQARSSTPPRTPPHPHPHPHQIYAYTSSRIQMRVLEEFCRLDCALPNLFVGTLTRDSVQRALAKGMSAGDVIGFLQSHAHPQVAGRVPSVPEVGLGLRGRLGCSQHVSHVNIPPSSIPNNPHPPPLPPKKKTPDRPGPDPAVGARDAARGADRLLLVLKL